MEYFKDLDTSIIVVLASLLGSTLLIFGLMLKMSGWKFEACKNCRSHMTKTVTHPVSPGSRLVDEIEKCVDCEKERATYTRTLPWWRR